MDFYSIRELRAGTKDVCKNVHKNGEAVITNNGKPSVLMLDISDGNYEKVLRAVRQAKAMIAVNEMRQTASENGFMTEEKIEAEISEARKDRKNNIEDVAV